MRYAGLAYRFHPGEQAEMWVQDRWIDEAWVPFCTYDLRAGDPVIRESAYQHHHTPGQSWVVDSLTLTRCDADEVWSLRNDELRHFTPDGKSERRIGEPEEYARLAAEVFNVRPCPSTALGKRSRSAKSRGVEQAGSNKPECLFAYEPRGMHNGAVLWRCPVSPLPASP